MNQLHNPWDQVWSWFLLSLQERFEPWDSLLQTCSSIDSSVIKTGLWRPRKEKGEKKRETRRTFWREKNGHNNCKDERTVQFERSLLLCPSSIESEGRNDDLEGRRLKVQFCKHLRGCFFQDQVYTLHGLLSLSLQEEEEILKVPRVLFSCSSLSLSLSLSIRSSFSRRWVILLFLPGKQEDSKMRGDSSTVPSWKKSLKSGRVWRRGCSLSHLSKRELPWWSRCWQLHWSIQGKRRPWEERREEHRNLRSKVIKKRLQWLLFLTVK